MGMRGIAREDPDRYALTVLNQALGGGMSSRLFQEVRERRGLAYAVYSYRVAYVETGAFGVYAGTAPGRAAETIDVVGTEPQRVIRPAGIGGQLIRPRLVGQIEQAMSDDHADEAFLDERGP